MFLTQFKIEKPINLRTIFKQFIEQKYATQVPENSEIWGKFIEISEAKAQFKFDDKNKQFKTYYHKNISSLEKLYKEQTSYLQSIFLLDNYFYCDILNMSHPNFIPNLSFGWHDSMLGENKKGFLDVKEIKFEIICQLYNLMITQFHLGISLISAKKAQESIIHFRRNLKIIQLINDYIVKISLPTLIAQEKGMSYDFSQWNRDILEKAFKALSYLAICLHFYQTNENISELDLNNPIFGENIFQYLSEALTYFKYALEIINNYDKEIPSAVKQEYTAFFSGLQLFTEAYFYNLLSNKHNLSIKLPNQAKANHMGKAIFSCNKALQICQQFTSKANIYKKYIDDIFITILDSIQKNAAGNIKAFQTRNDQIYKQQVSEPVTSYVINPDASVKPKDLECTEILALLDAQFFTVFQKKNSDKKD